MHPEPSPNLSPESQELAELLRAQMAANRLRLRKAQLRRQVEEEQRRQEY